MAKLMLAQIYLFEKRYFEFKKIILDFKADFNCSGNFYQRRILCIDKEFYESLKSKADNY